MFFGTVVPNILSVVPRLGNLQGEIKIKNISQKDFLKEPHIYPWASKVVTCHQQRVRQIRLLWEVVFLEVAKGVPSFVLIKD